MTGPPSILVIRRRYLGDIVLLGSLFRNLRLHWPGARIGAVVESVYAPILELNPDVDAVWSPPARVGDWPDFVRRLRAARYTHAFDIDNTEKTALITRLSGAAFRVGLHHGPHPFRLRPLYTHVAYDPGAEHESRPISEYYLKALGPAGVPVATREIRLVPRDSDVAQWRRFVGAQPKILLVHPGSRSASRIWPAERFAAVCDRIQDDCGAQVVLTGGPAERRLVSEIQAKMRTHPLVVRDPPSLPMLAALARACTALLCHDSGPMHVAAAVGTPVVALYGSQNPRLFQPAGTGHRLLIPTLPCNPCLAPNWCVPSDSYRSRCVAKHSVETVLEAARAVLAAGAPV